MVFGDAAISVLGDCPIDQGWVAVGFRRRAPWRVRLLIINKNYTYELVGAHSDMY